MAVYVDNYQGKFRGMVMCHMMSDTSLDELHAMADRLGLKRSWFQGDKSAPHYDVCLSKRIEALKHGAIDLNIRDKEWRRVYHAAKTLRQAVTQ